MMAYVGDPAAALLVDDGLIGAAALQIVIADELHVALLGLVVRRNVAGQESGRRGEGGDHALRARSHLLRRARFFGAAGRGLAARFGT